MCCRTIAFAVLLLSWSQALAQTDVRIGFLGLKDDPRYDSAYAYARIAVRTSGDSAEGARMAVSDMKVVTDARKISVTLDVARAPDLDGLQTEAGRMVGAGTQ